MAQSSAAAAGLYLDLLKRCLTDSIFIDHPLAHVRPFLPDPRRRAWRRAVGAVLSALADPSGFALVEVGDRNSVAERRAARDRGRIGRCGRIR
jgi:hypothetical protein